MRPHLLTQSNAINKVSWKTLTQSNPIHGWIQSVSISALCGLMQSILLGGFSMDFVFDVVL